MDPETGLVLAEGGSPTRQIALPVSKVIACVDDQEQQRKPVANEASTCNTKLNESSVGNLIQIVDDGVNLHLTIVEARR